MPLATIPERTFQFSRNILQAIPSIFKTFDSQILGRQLIRSATSVGANVIEAQHSSTKPQFLQYYHIALRSSRETEYWLRLIISERSRPDNQLTVLLSESQEISRILAASILRMKSSLNEKTS